MRRRACLRAIGVGAVSAVAGCSALSGDTDTPASAPEGTTSTAQSDSQSGTTTSTASGESDGTTSADSSTAASGETTSAGSTTGRDETTASASDGGPESAVRQYFTALQEGDKSAANQVVLNENIPMYVEDAEKRDITVQTIEQRDLRTVIADTQDVSGSTLDDRVERNRERLNSQVEENEEYSDWAVVYISVTNEDGTQEGYYFLYEVDGDWVLAGVTN